MKKSFTSIAYENAEDFIFGKSVYPVTLKNGLVIGGGMVYPEINFTLPLMEITKETMPDVLKNYKEMITDICTRSRELNVSGLIAEIEMLPPMTEIPSYGKDVCATVVDVVKEFEAKYGIKGAVRITPADIREGDHLAHMWSGTTWDAMLESFELCAKAGAELMSIESIGGKEVHDEAIMYCDLPKAIFALSVLACRDMDKLWTEIVAIGNKTGAIAAGDTACGFANTAMVLAGKNYIPKVFAAVIRVVSVIRNLVAYECGALGPHKDCGYEGTYIKAITGTPISSEGRVAACAHLSSVGNIASCVCDLWSNESVQNIKLLGGMAPTVSFEQLVYDCRLMNAASAKGHKDALWLQSLYAESDSKLDPQAYILRPDVVLAISKEIVKVDGHYNRAIKAAEVTIDVMKKANLAGNLDLNEKEIDWLGTLADAIATMPNNEDEAINLYAPDCEKLDRKKYDL